MPNNDFTWIRGDFPYNPHFISFALMQKKRNKEKIKPKKYFHPHSGTRLVFLATQHTAATERDSQTTGNVSGEAVVALSKMRGRRWPYVKWGIFLT